MIVTRQKPPMPPIPPDNIVITLTQEEARLLKLVALASVWDRDYDVDDFLAELCDELADKNVHVNQEFKTDVHFGEFRITLQGEPVR